MAKDTPEITIVSSREGADPDLRAIMVELDDPSSEVSALEHVKACIGAGAFAAFTWHPTFDGQTHTLIAVAREDDMAATAQAALSALTADPAVRHAAPLTAAPEPAAVPPVAPMAKAAMAAPAASWYWPVADRLPRSEYTAPEPILIAQADTGISMQPAVVTGFDPAESMSFFFPKGSQKGRGVICWGQGAPFFISHGTSTGGLMIGHSTQGLELDGMTPEGVVKLVPCRVADSVVLNPPDLARLAECINWAVAEGIKVVNVSLGAIAFPGDPALAALTRAVENAYKNGVIICAAAGQIAPGMIWPGVYALKGWVIACGPSTPSDTASAQSIWPAFQNGYVTIAGPGETMPQAGWKGGICASNTPEMGTSEGSSYATAFTSSVAALWWARNHEALSKVAPRDIVPLFRNTIQQTCKPWKASYDTAKFGPGIVDPAKAIQTISPPQDRKIESSGAAHIERVPGGTYKNLTLHAHGSGSIHVINPVFVEGKLTLISESSATISMSGTIICRELDIRIKNSALIEADDLEYYDSCKLDISRASTLRAYIAAEGPMSGRVSGPDFWNGSTMRAWIYWRNGRKPVSVSKDWMSTVDISHGWGGRWA